MGDACDACAGTPTGTAVSRFGCAFATFDFDRDGDADQDDLTILASCAGGPAVAYAATCTLVPDGESKIAADFDRDSDVDMDDFAVFQRCLSGANQPADPNCQ